MFYVFFIKKDLCLPLTAGINFSRYFFEKFVLGSVFCSFKFSHDMFWKNSAAAALTGSFLHSLYFFSLTFLAHNMTLGGEIFLYILLSYGFRATLSSVLSVYNSLGWCHCQGRISNRKSKFQVQTYRNFIL